MANETLSLQPVFDPENVGASLDRVQAQIPINAPWLSGSIVGDVVSRRKGDGYEMNGMRAYEPGDDPRNIDWNTTARQADQWPVLREHYQDVTPTLWVVTDMLQSRNAVGTPGDFDEQNLAMSAVASMMRIGQIQGMPVGVIASGNHKLAIQQKEPVQGKSFKTVKEMARIAEANAENSEAASFHLAQLLKYAGSFCRESVVAVVSDFRDTDASDPLNGWAKPLEKLTKNGNLLMAIETTNPWDYDLPDKVDRFKTTEGVSWIGGGKRGLKQRERYAAEAKSQQAEIDGTHQAAKAHHITLSTDEPRWLDSLKAQLKQ